VWKNLLFVSVDAPQSKPTCDSTSNTGSTPGWEGIRIFDVSDPTAPKYITSVATDCGSHTHTLVPDPKHNAVVLYIESYPLLGYSQNCNVHGKISVLKVPLDAPQKAAVVSQPLVAPAIGCHDVTVNIPLHLAAAACISEGQIWDISDPENPVIKTHIYNPAINIWHSAAFTMDGKVVAFGDEFGGGDGPGCPVDNPGSTSPVGAIWFYKVSDPTTPVGHYSLPRGVGSNNCTAHNFDVIPVKGHYLLAGCGYSEGTFVVDFTDPTAPKELGYYDVQGKQPADTWSSYWYNGYIYANDIGRGVDVFRFNDPIVKDAMRLPYLNPQTQMVSFTK
jgi:hypothetical protein